MQIQITFKHMESSEWMKEYATKQAEKLKKYFDGKIHVTWNFAAEKNHFVAHCQVRGNHIDFFGEASTEDMHGSIDQCIDKIEKQVKKHKEKVTDHHSH